MTISPESNRKRTERFSGGTEGVLALSRMCRVVCLKSADCVTSARIEAACRLAALA